MKSAPEKLKAKLPHENDLYDLVPMGFFCLNEEGQIVAANQMGTTLLDTEREQLIHRSMTEFMTAKDSLKNK